MHRAILQCKRLNAVPSYGVLSHDAFKKKTEGFGMPRRFLYEFFEILVYVYQCGTRDQALDAKQMFKYMMVPNKSAFMLSEIHRTKKDLLKFVPFSAFLVVPFAEILLPPYLYYFPNSLPTTYVFDDQLLKLHLKKDRKQMNSQRFLYQHIKGKFPELARVRDSQEFTPKSLQKWIVDNEVALTTHLDFKHMNSEQLVHVCKFFGMEFVRGTYIIMKTARLLANLPVYIYNAACYVLGRKDRKYQVNVKRNWNIKLWFPWEDLKRQLLLAQIRRHLRKVAREDLAFRSRGYDDLTLERLRNFTRERGLPAMVVQKDPDVEIDIAYSTKLFKRDWIEYCEKEQVFYNMRLWYSILYYERYHSIIVKDYEKRMQQLLH